MLRRNILSTRISEQFDNNLSKSVAVGEQSAATFSNLVTQLRFIQQLLEHCHLETLSEPKHEALADAYNALFELKDSIIEQIKGGTGLSCGEINLGTLPEYTPVLCDIAAEMICAAADLVQMFAVDHQLTSVENLAQELNGVGLKLKYKLSFMDVEGQTLTKSLETEKHVYQSSDISRFVSDLQKSFVNNECDFDYFEKAFKDVSHLEKKIITNKAGHKQTVYVRHHHGGEKHEFSHGNKVKFEHKGKSVVGTIHSLKYDPKWDKFGTAHIKDEAGTMYSKSLRNLSHHDVDDDPDSDVADDKDWQEQEMEDTGIDERNDNEEEPLVVSDKSPSTENKQDKLYSELSKLQSSKEYKSYLKQHDYDEDEVNPEDWQSDLDSYYGEGHITDKLLKVYKQIGESEDEQIVEAPKPVAAMADLKARMPRVHKQESSSSVNWSTNTGKTVDPVHPADHSDYEDFTAAEHFQAAKMHKQHSDELQKLGNKSASEMQHELAAAHLMEHNRKTRTEVKNVMSDQDHKDFADYNDKLAKYAEFLKTGSYPRGKFESMQEFKEDIAYIKSKRQKIAQKYNIKIKK